MAFKFLSEDASVEYGLRRIAISQLELALSELDGATSDPDAMVHAVRKRCKKIRGLLRLVRSAFPHFRRENSAIRAAAAGLSAARDARVLVQTFDRLLDAHEGQVDPRIVEKVRARLLHRWADVERTGSLPRSMAESRKILTKLRRRAEQWRLDDDSSRCLQRGYGRTVFQMQRAMQRAASSPDGETMHEWRKHVKYHWHHCCLLRALLPVEMKERRQHADELSEILGDHHNLIVLAESIGGRNDGGDKIGKAVLLRGLIAEAQAKLAARAFGHGLKFVGTSGRIDSHALRIGLEAQVETVEQRH